MEKRNLNFGKAKSQPWGGPYWPLYQGLIGNNYHNKDYKTFFFTILRNVDWKRNVSDFKKRSLKLYPKIYQLSEKDLSKLSPSEKYDLLLGDTNFDLTKKLWHFTEKWGYEKKWGFLSSIEIPNNFRIPKSNKLMALWEGICHGWAVAAGHMPRPEKTVFVTLPNGKKMPFYPNDIKALISLMWANSTIQSNVIFEGNRCNKKFPDRDKFGRYIDVKKDRNDLELIPRCADVHPGIFHVSLINIMGIEKRSFVIDKTPEAPITNQPVSAYELEYFNPKSGRSGNLEQSVLKRKDYPKDPYQSSRTPESTQIVGVEVKLHYTNWEFPRMSETNKESDDSIKGFKFIYDLELDESGNVVGGQWRTHRIVKRRLIKGHSNQPDFFWIVPRDWQNYFKPLENLPEWNFQESSIPPKEFLGAAKIAHSFVYEESERYFNSSPKCPVFGINDEEIIYVDCSFKYPRPQPLINVVIKLLEESRK